MKKLSGRYSPFCYFLCFLLFFTGCNSNRIDKVNIEEESTLLTDTIGNDEFSDYVWPPVKFKQEHPDEWRLVAQATDGETDFSKIDNLVREYIHFKNIEIPADKYLQIQKIEEICQNKFDIRDYDDTNYGMHAANNTWILFDEYVIWLLAQETSKDKTSGINFSEEEHMLNDLMEAFTNCCDSIGYAFDGSGGWLGYVNLNIIKNNFKKSMYAALLKPQIHQKQPLLLTAKHFQDECNARIRNYNPNNNPELPPSKTVKKLLDEYVASMEKWLQFRNKVESQITKPALKSEYSNITRIFAREHFIHLKNEFADIGMYSESMYEECYLHLDCTDEAMLSYSYENALKKYMNK